jgi:hypothetical protein
MIRRKGRRRRTGDELVVVEAGERDGVRAGALARAGGAALVGLHAGEAAGEAAAPGAPVLPRLLPALLARGPLAPAAGGGAGVGGRAPRGRRLLSIVLHSRGVGGSILQGDGACALGFNWRFISARGGRHGASVELPSSQALVKRPWWLADSFYFYFFFLFV